MHAKNNKSFSKSNQQLQVYGKLNTDVQGTKTGNDFKFKSTCLFINLKQHQCKVAKNLAANSLVKLEWRK